MTTTVGATLTLRLTVRLRSTAAGTTDTEIVPEYTGTGDAGGVLVNLGTQFQYRLNTNSTEYPIGTINTAAYFTSLVTATYNSQPGVAVAREDARLETSTRGK